MTSDSHAATSSASAAASPPLAGSPARRRGRDRAGPRAPTRSERDVPARRRRRPLVALRFVFRVGSQDDPPGKEGLAALTAAMVAEGGTKELTYDQLLEQFYPMAAGARRALPQGSHGLRRRGPPRQPRRLRPAGRPSMLTTPRFAPEDFERLRTRRSTTSPRPSAAATTRSWASGPSSSRSTRTIPTATSTGGPCAGLKAITLDDVKAFHKQHYARERARTWAWPGASIEAFVARARARPRLARRRGVRPGRSSQRRSGPKGLEVTIVEKPADCDGHLARASRSTSPAATTTSTPWPSPTRTWASTGRSTAS